MGDDGTITVNHALACAEGGFYVKDPKTKGLKRTIPLTTHTYNLLRAVASYLGHASVSMTLNTYADVDPDAKKAAVSKVEESFDLDFYHLSDALETSADNPQDQVLSFTEEQLEAMLAQIRSSKARTMA